VAEQLCILASISDRDRHFSGLNQDRARDGVFKSPDGVTTLEFFPSTTARQSVAALGRICRRLLLLPQRGKRINLRRTPRRDATRQERDQDDQAGDTHVDQWIVRPHLKQHAR